MFIYFVLFLNVVGAAKAAKNVGRGSRLSPLLRVYFGAIIPSRDLIDVLPLPESCAYHTALASTLRT